jgi:hypothetical protein
MIPVMPWKPLALLLTALALLCIPAAAAKDFKPGDLRVCGAARCVAIVNPDVLTVVSAFYYSNGQPPATTRPALAVPFFQLKFKNGYITGIVATSKLDRFLSYGVNLGRFTKNRWYAVPAPFAAELKRLTLSIRPLHLTQAELQKAH